VAAAAFAAKRGTIDAAKGAAELSLHLSIFYLILLKFLIFHGLIIIYLIIFSEKSNILYDYFVADV